MTPLEVLNKSCGDCTACCTALGVKELKKDEFKPCQHICKVGCAIYDERPEECRTYRCFWLSSDLPEEFRPDNCGIIMEVQESKLGPCVMVREVKKGAAKEMEWLVGHVAQFVQGFIYISREGRGREIVLPPWSEHLRDKVQALAYEHWDGKREIDKL